MAKKSGILVEAEVVHNMTVNSRDRYAEELRQDWVERYDKTPLWDDVPKPGKDFRVPPMPRGKVVTLNKKGEMIFNDDWNSWINQTHLLRVNWMQAMIDPRRNLEVECGYPPMIIPKQYRYMYDREGIATRCVQVYPDECWAVTPDVYEIEHPSKKTPFELSWELLNHSSDNNPLHYLHRVDVLSGIGRYGVLMFGLNDDKDLSEPVLGLDAAGFPVKVRNKPNYAITFMRPFDELMCHVINYERDSSNPRFGQPVYYHIIFADIRVGEPGMTAASISVTSRVVHWTRCLHIVDNRESSEVFGVPRMQSVFNRLCDCRKILGGSGEMFWKGGFPGYSFELNPDLVTAGVTLDQESLKQQLNDWANGLQRYLSIVGLQAKSLAPQVADPTPHLTAHLSAIALSLGVPLRIFMGSEQAQLASGQDVRTWNRRLQKRQERYLTPKVIRPFINRLLALGIMPMPAKGLYKVAWPDINVPSDIERAQIADHTAAALMKYVIGGGYQVVPPKVFLTMFLGFSEEKVAVIMEEAKKWDKNPDFEIINPNSKADDALPGEGGSSGPSSSTSKP